MDYIEGLSYTLYENMDDFLNQHPNADIYYITRYGKKFIPIKIFLESVMITILCLEENLLAFLMIY